jgi:iron(III) transport system substrate-binding protein
MSSRLIFGLLASVLVLAALATSLIAPSDAENAGEVNVYSYRQPQLVEGLFAKFTEATGIRVNTIYASKGLIERMAAEGENSPADILLTTDISRLTAATEAGLAQPVESDILNTNIPEAWRDPDNEWFALTLRARVIYASRERVEQENIRYEDLANPEWRGRICTRSGQHYYSLGLIGSMIAQHGVADTEEWLDGVRANLAHKPTGNDRAQVRSIYSGECDIALGNTYYMGRMETNTNETEQQDWARSVRIIFPNAEDRGTHVNVSGVVMARYAPNPEAALALMEFLAGDEAQQIYAEVNHEYPVNPDIPASDRVRSWGELRADQISISEIAEHAREASEMVDRVGFDDGPNS